MAQPPLERRVRGVTMNTLENWFVKRTMAKEVIQGWDHARKIEALYALIREVCEEEFTEDNAPTMDAFLRERFEATQYTPNVKVRGGALLRRPSRLPG